MPRRTSIASWLIAAVLIFSVGTAWGRPIESWPYDKLFENADLVIIAKALSVRDAPEMDGSIPRGDRDYLRAVATTLKVEYVVKGKYEDERLELFHFRMKKEYESRSSNGPMLVKFNTKPLEGPGWSGPPPEYMLFLKKSKDGRLQCISGQFDPELSVKQILEAWMGAPSAATEDDLRKDDLATLARGGIFYFAAAACFLIYGVLKIRFDSHNHKPSTQS
jgi:hypothetical protein